MASFLIVGREAQMCEAGPGLGVPWGGAGFLGCTGLPDIEFFRIQRKQKTLCVSWRGS